MSDEDEPVERGLEGIVIAAGLVLVTFVGSLFLLALSIDAIWAPVLLIPVNLPAVLCLPISGACAQSLRGRRASLVLVLSSLALALLNVAIVAVAASADLRDFLFWPLFLLGPG